MTKIKASLNIVLRIEHSNRLSRPTDLIKPSAVQKLANKVKYISQINGGLIVFYWKFEFFLN